MPHKKPVCPILCLLLCVLAPSCREGASPAPRGLAELDSYVAARPVYETRKRDQLEGIRKMIASTSGPRRLFDYGMYAADEYFSYSFDSTQFYLKRCLDIATQLHDVDRYNRAAIRLGHLYAKAGHYMEAYNRLFSQIDTNTLSGQLRIDYLMALYDFSRDLADNSGMVERPPIQDRGVYRQRLYGLLPKDSEQWRVLQMDELMTAKRFDAADSLAQLVLAGTKPEEVALPDTAEELADTVWNALNPDNKVSLFVRAVPLDGSAPTEIVCNKNV